MSLMTTDFMFLGADGNVYRPRGRRGWQSAAIGRSKAGHSGEGDVVFRVPFGGGMVQLYGGPVLERHGAYNLSIMRLGLWINANRRRSR